MFKLKIIFPPSRLFLVNNLGLEKATQLRWPYLIFKALFKTNFNEQYFTCCIFSDLSKAFDIVNHKILINKSNTYGIQGKMHSLHSYYLKNHNQYTQCNDIDSKLNTYRHCTNAQETL